jgi:hypothetical protein
MTATFPLTQLSYGHGNVDDIKDKSVMFKKAAVIQLPFIENLGQIKNESVRFYANTFAGTVHITDKGDIVYNFLKTDGGSQNKDVRQEHPGSLDRSIVKGYAIKETIEGIENSDIDGIDATATRVNYFKGNKEDWTSNITTWNKVSFGKVYSNIDMELRAYGNNVEKLFTVHPKGKVSDIKMRVEGTEGIFVNRNGELEIETELGNIIMTKPEAYQEIGGKMVQIAVNYVTSDKKLPGHDSKFTYGFKVGEYDRTKNLVIDPLLASSFAGGSYDDMGGSVAIDSSGNVFVAGYTNSSNYPTITGAYDVSYNGDKDIFILKLNNTLGTLMASTYIGGSNNDRAFSMAIDTSGNVFISGYTYSSNYPATPGAYDTSRNDTVFCDVFISKLDNTLSTLLASTFIGGRFYDSASSIIIEPSGNVLITGYTMSVNYPTTSGAYDNAHNDSGQNDVFISKLNSTLSTLLASTFVGGNAGDSAEALVVDPSGNIFITGTTWSSDFPTTPGAYDPYYSAEGDAFVSKFNSTLSSLLASTFIGGVSTNYGYDIAIDQSGNILVTGETYAFPTPDFPVTTGAYDTSPNGKGDVFISKLNSTLNTLLASTLIGGVLNDNVRSMSIDQSGDVVIAGYSESGNYPTTPEAYDPSHNGGYDFYVSKLNSALNILQYSTYIGGTDADYAYSMAIDTAGDVFIVGSSNSAGYPTTPEAYDTTYTGGTDIIISKLSFVSYADNDGDGYLSNTDCDDNDPLEHPDQTWYLDADSDGYSDGSMNTSSCERPLGYKAAMELHDISGDCDDNDPVLNPQTLWHPDFDGDSHGNPAVSLQQCSPPEGYVLSSTDCDDSDVNIYPGGPPVRISLITPVYFSMLQTAYDSAGDGETVTTKAVALTENLNFNLNKSITLDGGYDCGYSIVTGKTIVNGTITISNGAVIIGNLEVH